jgi:hypothetical protein
MRILNAFVKFDIFRLDIRENRNYYFRLDCSIMFLIKITQLKTIEIFVTKASSKEACFMQINGSCLRRGDFVKSSIIKILGNIFIWIKTSILVQILLNS